MGGRTHSLMRVFCELTLGQVVVSGGEEGRHARCLPWESAVESMGLNDMGSVAGWGLAGVTDQPSTSRKHGPHPAPPPLHQKDSGKNNSGMWPTLLSGLSFPSRWESTRSTTGSPRRGL